MSEKEKQTSKNKGKYSDNFRDLIRENRLIIRVKVPLKELNNHKGDS